MTRSARPVVTSIGAFALAALFAAPVLAQRPTAEKTTTLTRATAPADDAAAALRAGQPAGTAARSLVDTHRLESAGVARVLIQAGYDAGSVGRALSTEMRVPPERAWTDLSAAGTTDLLIFSAMLQMVRERSEALAILRQRLGASQSLSIIQKSDDLEATEEEIAADMAAAGYSLAEIIEVLTSDPYSMSAEDLLALFLKLNLATVDDAEVYEALREEADLTAREAAAAMADKNAEQQAAALRAAGYGWDDIVDALDWAGETAMEAAKAALAAGAPLGDMIQWLIDAGHTEKEILDHVADAKNDLVEVAIGLMQANQSALDVATGLHDAGMPLEDIVQFLTDQGLSPEQIVAILQELQASAATIIQLLMTTMQMSYDTAMAVLAASSN